jgi:hypothetical protein
MAIYFDGDQDRITASTGGYFINSLPVTMGCWFRTWKALSTPEDDHAGEWMLGHLWRDSSRMMHMRLDDNSGGWVGVFQGGWQQGSGWEAYCSCFNNPVRDTKWHFGTIARAQNDSVAILDGDLDNKASSSDTMTASTEMDTFEAAAWLSSSVDEFQGDMAWLMLWNARITDNESVEMAQGRHPMTVQPDKIRVAFPMYNYETREHTYGQMPRSAYSVSTNGLTAAKTTLHGPPTELWVPGRTSVSFMQAPSPYVSDYRYPVRGVI